MTRRPPSFPPTTLERVEPAPPVAPARVSDGFADRLAERQRSRRRLRLRAIAIVAAVLVVLAGAGYVALASPLLALQTEDITVVGANDLVPAQEILAIAEPQAGQPLLRLDTGGLREAVLQLPGVLSATVERDFPHGLVITVEPRHPVATVQQGGSYVLLDAEGVELASTAEPYAGVPQVSIPVGTDETAAALESVLTVLASLPQELLTQVTQARASTAFEVELTLASGSTVVWGSAEDSELKATVLATLLQIPAAVYDVSAPLSPITR